MFYLASKKLCELLSMQNYKNSNYIALKTQLLNIVGMKALFLTDFLPLHHFLPVCINAGIILTIYSNIFLGVSLA